LRARFGGRFFFGRLSGGSAGGGKHRLADDHDAVKMAQLVQS